VSPQKITYQYLKIFIDVYYRGVIGAVHAVLGLPKSMLLKYGDTTVQWMKEGYLNDKQLEYFDQWIGEMVPGFIADWASMKKVTRSVYTILYF
jgi:hypothetical protein